MDRSAVRPAQSSGRERAGGKPCPHRMVPLGGQYLSCVRGAVLCQRIGTCVGTGFGGISFRADRAAANCGRQGFRTRLRQLRGIFRGVSAGYGAGAAGGWNGRGKNRGGGKKGGEGG